MNSNVAGFTTNLSTVSQSFREYIILQGDDEYQITNQKENKNLNTQQIAEIASSFFSFFDNDEVTIWLKKENLLNFAQSLSLYSNRVIKSKNFALRALNTLSSFSEISFYRTASEAEFKIFAISNKIFYSVNKKMAQIERWGIKLKNELEKPEMILKYFYLKVLGLTNFKSKFLDGTTIESSYYSYLKDIEDFEKKIHNQNSKIILNQILNELYFAAHIEGIDQDRLTTKQKAQHIIHRLNHLPIFNENRENPYACIVLSGGYSGINESGTSHSAMYQIQRESDSTYSFRIINSGEGSIYSSTQERAQLSRSFLLKQIIQLNDKIAFSEDEDLIRQYKKQIADLSNKLNKVKEAALIKDLVFFNLSKNQLSEEFFEELLEYKYNPNKCSSMEQLMRMLQKRLLEPNGENKALIDKHHLQIKGNCGTKCVTIWLKSRWGQKIHDQFKAHITKKEMGKFQNFLKENPIENLQKYFAKYFSKNSKFKEDFNPAEAIEQMKKEGDWILQKRTGKAEAFEENEEKDPG